jgi:hypothetical protein
MHVKVKSGIERIREISFISLSIISGILNLNLFIQLVYQVIEKFFLGALSLALESTKIFFLVTAGIKLYISSIEKNKKIRSKLRRKAMTRYALYFGFALLAIVASFGFTLMTLDYKSQLTSDTSNQFKIDIRKNSITENNVSIKLKQDSYVIIDGQLTKIKDATYVGAQQQLINRQKALTSEIEILKADNNKLNTEIEKLKEEDSKKEKSAVEKDMFVLIGSAIHMDSQLIRLLILIAISILLEVGIFATSSDNDLLILEKLKEKKINSFDIDISDISSNSNVDIQINKSDTDELLIKEDIVKFIYDRIYYYVKDQLDKNIKDESQYHEIDFQISDINFDNINKEILLKYWNYLSQKGLLVKSIRIDQNNNNTFDCFKLKIFKDFNNLNKRRIR